jgi:arabinogalactan endo-1,4-beta-galactosidase
LGENKHTFCEGNERGALLVTGSELSLLAKTEVKGGKFHNKEGWVNKCFEHLNIWEQP